MPKGFGRPQPGDQREIGRTIRRIEGLTGKTDETRGFRSDQVKYMDQDLNRRITGQNTAAGKDIGELDRLQTQEFREKKAAAAQKATDDAQWAEHKKQQAQRDRNIDNTFAAQDRGQIPVFKENKASRAAGYRKGGMVGKTRSSKTHVNWGK
jgi:hypothetical protein